MHFIPIEELKGRKKSALLKFLARYEEFCVQLSAQIRKTSSCVYAVFASEVQNGGKDADSDSCNIYGIVSIRKTILHCLPYANIENPTAMQEDFVGAFAALFSSGGFENPVCVNGMQNGSALILKALGFLGFEPQQTNEYCLLKLDIEEFKKWIDKGEMNERQGLSVIRCRSDIPAEIRAEVFELQKKYEVEEVVPACLTFDEDSCRLRLANSFRTQYILALAVNENGAEKIVAKAGTNAVGRKHVQLGGVYTLPEYRGRRYALYLMTVLLVRLLKMRCIPVLFVKKKNVPALGLYKSLSFKNKGDYTISYFK